MQFVCLLTIRIRDSNSGKGYEIFLFSETSRTALISIQPFIQWLPGVKRPGLKAEHSSSSSVELKTSETILSLRPTCLHSTNRDNTTLSLEIPLFYY